MPNAWMTHLKATMKRHPSLSLSDAMKEAKKTYKKTAKHHKGGFLVKVGGKRRKTMKGGQLYGFGEQDGPLSDGMGRITPTGSVADASNSVYAPKGGRRHRRRHTKRR